MTEGEVGIKETEMEFQKSLLQMALPMSILVLLVSIKWLCCDVAEAQ